MENGHTHEDRTGVGRRSVFGRMLRFDLNDGFPMVTTRQVPFKNPVRETLWFIEGNTSAKELAERGCSIWDKWAVKESDIEAFLVKYPHLYKNSTDREVLKQSLITKHLGSIGPMYGFTWRKAPNDASLLTRPIIKEEDIATDKLKKLESDYSVNAFTATSLQGMEGILDFETFATVQLSGEVDQLQELINNLKVRPYSSRHVISAWIPQFIPYEGISAEENVLLGKGALAPCHVLQQYFVSPPNKEGGKLRLSLKMDQRSADVPVGSATNIPQYALLLTMIAQCVNMEPYELIYSLGDAHIYTNQFDGVREQLTRTPRPLPRLIVNKDITNIYDFKSEHFRLEGYDPVQPPIVYPVAK